MAKGWPCSCWQRVAVGAKRGSELRSFGAGDMSARHCLLPPFSSQALCLRHGRHAQCFDPLSFAHDFSALLPPPPQAQPGLCHFLKLPVPTCSYLFLRTATLPSEPQSFQPFAHIPGPIGSWLLPCHTIWLPPGTPGPSFAPPGRAPPRPSEGSWGGDTSPTTCHEDPVKQL